MYLRGDEDQDDKDAVPRKASALNSLRGGLVRSGPGLRFLRPAELPGSRQCFIALLHTCINACLMLIH